MRADLLPQQVREFLEETGVCSGMTVCCALSGGADSVCLLRCLLALRETLGLTVTAVHVNHNLRGAEALRDQWFCEALCQKHHVPLQVFSVQVRERAAREKCSEELAARYCRYEAFEQVQADFIATAHTASDNLETMLYRLARGSGLHGLASIPPKNGRLIRPLLTVTREMVEAYLTALGQDHVTDSTNLTDAYTRNRIRHSVVPSLRQLNPSLERTAVHTLRSLRLEDDYLAQQAAAAFAANSQDKHTLSGLDTMHPAIGMRCLAMLLGQWGIAYDAQLLERLYQLTRQGGRWNLTGNVYAAAKQGTLKIEELLPAPKPLTDCVPLKQGENRLYDGFVLYASVISVENSGNLENVHEKSTNYCLDYDKIKGSVFLRPRQYGERIQLCGRSFTSSLKKLIQSHVPPQRRQTLHILADDDGIVYAEWIGIADRVRPDERTRRLLVVYVSESDE